MGYEIGRSVIRLACNERASIEDYTDTRAKERAKGLAEREYSTHLLWGCLAMSRRKYSAGVNGDNTIYVVKAK